MSGFASNSDFRNPSYISSPIFRPKIFFTIIEFYSSLKYQRFTPSGCNNLDSRKFMYVVKIQFLKTDLISNLLNTYEEKGREALKT